MKQIIYIRLAFLVIIGAVIAYTLFYFTFAYLVPMMSDNAATVFIGVLLGLWWWRFWSLVKWFKKIKL